MAAKLKIKYLLTAVFIGGGLFVCAHGASAAYFKTGALVSANLLAGQTYVGALTSFNATASTSADTSATIQFSRNKLIWYDRLGTAYASTTLANGANTLDLTPLSWSGPVLYYKLNFYTNGGANTASVSEVTVNYDASATPTSDYFREGTLVSKNMLDGITDAGAITQFSATADIPAGAAITAQFSLNKLVWYDRLGTAYASTTLANGANNLDLTGLNWSGPIIYYKLRFTTSDSGVTGNVSHVQIQYSAGAETTIKHNQGTLLSKDLLGSATDLAIQYFGYNLSSLPAGTTATIMFATTTGAFYDSAGTLWASSTLAVGDHLATSSAISLIPLNWSAKNFYYKIIFSTANPSATPVLTEVTLYAPAPVCGDRICSSPETHATCPADCPLTSNTSGSTIINSSRNYNTAGLVGYWTFDGGDTNWGTNKTNDMSGSGNTGTMVNMSTTTSPVAGISGQALKFDGVDDYVSLPGASKSSNFPTKSGNTNQNMTVAGWIKLNTVGNYRYLTGDFEFNVGGANFYYDKDDAQLHCTYSGGGAYAAAISGTDLATGRWYHIACVIDSANNLATIYLNSVVDSNGASNPLTTAVNLDGTINELRIGGAAGMSNYMNGLIDEVRVYNRALTPAEILEQYKAGAARMTVNTPAGSGASGLSSGLVGYWSFDGQNTTWSSASAGTTSDLSGSGNTGTMTNMSRSASPAIGISGQALKFDGVDDKVSVANSASLRPNAITILVWAKKTSSQTSSTYILGKAASANTDYGLRILNSSKIDTIYNANTNFAGTRSTTFNGWNHIVFIGDSSGASIYLNGTIDTSTTTAFVTPDNSSAFEIGYSLYSTYFPGLIDDVRIYNRALTADEVLQLYKVGTRAVEFRK